MSYTVNQNGTELSVEERIAATLESESQAEPKKEDEKPEASGGEPKADPEPKEDLGEGEGEGEEEEPDDADDSKFNSIEELAEAAGMSLDDVLAMVKGKVKVQGEEKEISFSEAMKGHMLESDYRQKTTELAQAKRTFEQELVQARQIMEANLAESVRLANALEAEFLHEFKDIQWESLRREDPVEYNLKKTERAEKLEKLNLFKQNLLKQHKLAQEKAEAEKAETLQKYATSQRDTLNALIPDWVDEQVSQKESGEIRAYLKDAFSGDLALNDADIDNIVDARLIYLFRKAMAFDKAKANIKIVEKQVKKTPVLLKPGAKASEKERQSSASKAQRERFRKSGSTEDAAALIAAHL